MNSFTGFSSKNKTKLSWADMCDEDEDNEFHFYEKVDNLKDDNIKDIHKDVELEFNKKEEQETIRPVKSKKEAKKIHESIEKYHDNPANLNEKYILKENMYKNDDKKRIAMKIERNIKKNEQKDKDGWKTVQKKKKSRKCYTCHPRKKVSDHIIKVIKGITFHHDMCERNVIVATPKRHYSSLEVCSHREIGELFKAITEFCNFWNIKDYSISYNQGSWQSHSHFHVKIKTHEQIISRMRNDHFSLLKREKERNMRLN